MTAAIRPDRPSPRRPSRAPCPAPVTSSLAFAVTLLAGLPVASADDTEIFFGRVGTGVNTDPNVLFVLDTSGSMTNTDGTGLTRLQRMKDALHRILDESSRVNVGIMRFQGREGGAAVIEPIRPIDEEVCGEDGCNRVSLSARVASDEDDVEERLSDGQMTRDGDALSMSLGDGTEQAVGLRFTGLAIPQGARILSAELEFHADRDSGAGAALTIAAEASDDAAAFTDASADLSSRATGDTASWTPSAWTAGERYVTDADLAPLIQEIVDRPGWCGGNALALLVEGPGGDAHAKSFRQSSAEAPLLRVAYDPTSIPASGGCTVGRAVTRIASSADDAEEQLDDNSMYITSSDLELPNDGSTDQLVGLRFTGVEVPPGATVTRASIEFTVDEYKSGWSSLHVHAEASDDAAGIGGGRGDLSERDRVAAARVSWTGTPELSVDDTVETPDLSALVQEIVDRDGWEAGNAMLFLVEDQASAGPRTMESRDGEAGSAPLLRIDYRLPSGSGALAAGRTILARDLMKETVTAIDHASGTPIVDAYYEAAQYMRGGPVHYGRTRGIGNVKPANRVSHVDSWEGGSVYRPAGCEGPDDESSACEGERIDGSPSYLSPMSSSCQTNHIVLLTDGQASSISAAERVRTLIGADSCAAPSNDKELCGRELAEWLYDTDHRSDLGQKQNVYSHFIGLELGGSNSGFTFLEDMARLGGGKAYEASSSAELVDAFKSIIGEAVAVDTAFVAPGATVNQFNRLTHRSDIYFALFKPDTRPSWNGNLKRYEVDAAVGGGIRIADADGEEAVDAANGFFHEGARSFWSDAVDGQVVSLGGAAAELAEGGDATTRRKVLTWIGDNAAIPAGGVPLDVATGQLHEDNPLISLATLGRDGLPGSDAEREEARVALLRWMRGVDVKDRDDDGDTDEMRGEIGDPMHSRPTILNYSDPAGSGEGSVLTTIFVATNEGLLHAIDRREGREVFAFMPQELLANGATLYDDDAAERHPYGLDGALTVWTEDSNNNVMIDAGEPAMLYVGMRRGGSNLYAFDVSSRAAPKLAWVIEGGAGGSDGFAELGQSWSAAVPTRMMIDGVARQVLLFGAGYDPNQDPDPNGVDAARTADGVGRGFFVVDALTGERLWAATGALDSDFWHADLEYSVPGDLRVIDLDFDGFVDQIWFGDTGGQIWRFDVTPYHASGPLMTGGVVARLSGPERAGERRFYYEPDVALIGDAGQRFLSIAIGSGWRAHPLDTDVEDRFYVLRSDAIYGTPEGYGRKDGDSWRPITEADLTDVTSSLAPTVGAYGWYIRLDSPGEKVLGDSITVNEQVVFTTYRPEPTLGACQTALGSGAVYVVDVRDGSPTVDTDGDGVLELDDRDKGLAHGGIPPEPTALITAGGPTILVGPEQPVAVDFDNLTQRSFWRDEGKTRRTTSALAEEE